MTEHRTRVLERIALVHISIFAVATTWLFGGQADWIRAPLASWGSLSVVILVAAIVNRDSDFASRMQALCWLWPLVLFNLLVIAATFNPSFRPIQFEGETLLVNQGGRAGWPSSARPLRALEALWLFDALWLSCFNVAMTFRRRRTVRALLWILAANALVLAVFGTIQKVSGARGLYFDAIRSPQVNFFASFVYHNHWGAYAVLMMSAWLGLIWNIARRMDTRVFFHSPAFGGVITVFLIAAAVPLSNSRSCTILTFVLLSAAFGHLITRIVVQRRHQRQSAAGPVAGAFLAIAIMAAGIWYVAGPSIAARFKKTQDQIADMQAQGTIGARAVLYHDTWRMAKDKLWFGWGMASYPHVFSLYNSRESKVDRLPVNYRDAHSDWLQSFAEHGFVGSALLGLCAIVPLIRIRPRSWSAPVPLYLLGGCTLIALYAWIEFPFGNVAVILTWWLCYFCAIQYARLHEREPKFSHETEPESHENPTIG